MNKNNAASPKPGASLNESARRKLMRALWHRTRQVFILIAGVTVILIGFVLIFTPGPAIVVIPAGIAILATEFVWARKLLARFKASALSAANAALGKYPPDPSDTPGSDAHLVFYRRYWRRLCQVIRSGVAPFRKSYLDVHHDHPADSTTPHDPSSGH